MKVGKLLTQYDESQCYENEIKYRLEYWEDHWEEKPTEEEVQDFVYNDYELLNFYWEDIQDYLTEILTKKNPNGYWKCNVNNFGWRNLDGYAYKEINNGKDLVTEILPDCDCTFRVYNYGKGIAIQNFHHDSPTGNEWYYLTPIKESTYYNNN